MLQSFCNFQLAILFCNGGEAGRAKSVHGNVVVMLILLAPVWLELPATVIAWAGGSRGAFCPGNADLPAAGFQGGNTQTFGSCLARTLPGLQLHCSASRIRRSLASGTEMGDLPSAHARTKRTKETRFLCPSSCLIVSSGVRRRRQSLMPTLVISTTTTRSSRHTSTSTPASRFLTAYTDIRLGFECHTTLSLNGTRAGR